MKAIYSTLFLSCALLASCTNDDLVSEGASVADGQEIKVTASLGNNSRTYYEYQQDEKLYKTFWEAGDDLCLLNENQDGLKYTASEIDPAQKTTATFLTEGEPLIAAPGDKVYAYYPYKENSAGTVATVDGNSIQIWRSDNRPAAGDGSNSVGQLNLENSTPLDFIYTSGTVGDDNTLALKNFKHVYAFMKLTIPTEMLKIDPSANSYYSIMVKALGYPNALGVQGKPQFDMQEGAFTKPIQQYTNKGVAYVKYYIPKEAVEASTGILSCYIAVLPVSYLTSGASNDIEISTGGDAALRVVLATKEIPADGLKVGHVYPVTLSSGAGEEEDAIAGTYACTYTNYKKKAASFTAELVKIDDTTYEMKGIPRTKTSQAPESLKLTYNPTDKTLALYAGQVFSDGSVLYFANSKDCITGSFSATFYHKGGEPKTEAFATKDSNVAYFATYSTSEDNKPVFTFNQGTWTEERWTKDENKEQTIVGIVGATEEVTDENYADTFKAYVVLFDLVMTKE